MSKTNDHKAAQGKNVRITTSGWEKIRKYCFLNNLKMGAFVEQSALERISQKVKKSNP